MKCPQCNNDRYVQWIESIKMIRVDGSIYLENYYVCHKHNMTFMLPSEGLYKGGI